MAFDGNGNWSSVYFPTQDRDDGIKILASKFETLIQTNLPASFQACATVDSQTLLTANWNFNSYKGINLLAGVSSTDAVNVSQLDDRANTDLSNLTATANASSTSRGVAKLSTSAQALGLTNNDTIMTPYRVGEVLSSGSTFMDGYIKGLLPSNGTDADHDIDFSTGRCRDAANSLNVIVSTGMTKQLDQTFVVGTGLGGLASPLSISADTTYHCFVLAGGLSAATAGTFITTDLTSNLSGFQAVSDGYLTAQVDGDALQVITGLDFTLASDMDDVATVLSNQITGATVSNSSGVLTFTSATTGSSSAVVLFDNTGTGTNLFGASYLDATNGTASTGEDDVAGAVDFGFDTSVDATNLLADANVIAGGFTKYRRVGSILTDASSNIIGFTATETAGSGVDYLYTTTITDLFEALPAVDTWYTRGVSVPNGMTVICQALQENTTASGNRFRTAQSDGLFDIFHGAISDTGAFLSSGALRYKTTSSPAIKYISVGTQAQQIYIYTFGYADSRV